MSMMKKLFGIALLASSILLSGVNAGAPSSGADNEGAIQNMIGIDLGTTFSCMGVWVGDTPQVITNKLGERTTPSWVAFPPDGSPRLIGAAAKNQAPKNPSNTIFDSKRLIGREYKDPAIQKDLKSWPFTVVDVKGKPQVQVDIKGEKKNFAPEQLSAMILSFMKESAEYFLGQKVTHAVVTVPAYFNDAQRSATKDAGTIAGLNVARVLNEPTAAALAYGLDKKKEANIVVFDLGGGTFDVSLLVVDNGVFEVKAVNGDTHLGGQDFDNNMMEFVLKDVKGKHSVDLSKDKKFKGLLRQECEKAKLKLSSAEEVTIELDIKDHNIDYTITISRTTFEKVNKADFDRTIPPVKQALADAGWSIKDVDDVVLVGGSTRIPKIQAMLKDFFQGKELSKSINPDEAVAFGATLQAGVLMGKNKAKDLLVLDATPLTLGIQTMNDVFARLIERNSLIPAKKTQIFSTASDNQDTVEISVFEGERPLASKNHFLGKFFLRNIPLAPRGIPQIEVTFEVDSNGILTVTARDLASGNKESINITSDKRRLSDAEIQRMVQEAEENKQADEEMKEKLAALSELENYIYQLRGQVTDEKGVGSKISKEDKKTILDEVSAKAKWIEDNKSAASKEDFEEQMAAVKAVADPIMSKLYGGQEPGEASAAPSDHEEL